MTIYDLQNELDLAIRSANCKKITELCKSLHCQDANYEVSTASANRENKQIKITSQAFKITNNKCCFEHLTVRDENDDIFSQSFSGECCDIIEDCGR